MEIDEGEDRDDVSCYSSRDFGKFEKSIDGEFVCSLDGCQRVFSSVTNQARHNRAFLCYVKGAFVCKYNVCTRTFKSTKEAMAHSLIHGKVHPSTQKFKCTSLPISAMRKHVKKHHTTKIQCIACVDVLYNETLFKQHVAKHRVDDFICTKCTFSCGSAENIKRHMQRHAENIKRHMQRHANNNDHPCKECGMLFSTPEEAESHNITHHSMIDSDGQVLIIF